MSQKPISSCAWCEKSLADVAEPKGLGARLKEDADLGDGSEFMVGIELPEEDRSVYALLPPPGSPAHEEDHDLWFVLCSEGCGQELEERLSGGLDEIDATRFFEE